MPPTVSVIVALHRRTPAFERCVEATLRQLRGDDELLVVSDSDPGALPAGVRLLITGAVGDTSPAEKRDVALEVARGDICVFLDDDAYPGGEWIQRALERFEDPAIVGVGGPGVTPPASTWRERAGGAFYESPFGSGGLRFRFTPIGPVRDVDDFPAYNFFVRRSSSARSAAGTPTFTAERTRRSALNSVEPDTGSSTTPESSSITIAGGSSCHTGGR